MKIKLIAALLTALCATGSATAVRAEGVKKPAAPVTPAAAQVAPASVPQGTPPTAAQAGSNDMNMKGNLQIDALGFKGTLNFDGNPLNILQQIPGVKPAEQAPGATPQQPMMMPQQQMMVPQQQMMTPQQQMMTPQQQMMMPQQQMMMPQQQMMVPMGQAPMAVPQQSAQPAAPMIDFSGMEKAARAIAPNVIRALPALGLPAGPAFINQGQKVIQSVFGGANGATSQPMMQPMQQPAMMPMTAAPPASVDVLNQLDQLSRQVKFNVEMAQEASYLASFGEPSMRATSALEAQKNANEARTIADRAGALAGNSSGEAAQIVANIRDSAGRAQALADQARTSSNAGNGLAP
jgi:hypothetical protein